MKTFKMYPHRVHLHPYIWDAFATKNYVFQKLSYSTKVEKSREDEYQRVCVHNSENAYKCYPHKTNIILKKCFDPS